MAAASVIPIEFSLASAEAHFDNEAHTAPPPCIMGGNNSRFPIFRKGKTLIKIDHFSVLFNRSDEIREMMIMIEKTLSLFIIDFVQSSLFTLTFQYGVIVAELFRYAT